MKFCKKIIKIVEISWNFVSPERWEPWDTVEMIHFWVIKEATLKIFRKYTWNFLKNLEKSWILSVWKCGNPEETQKLWHPDTGEYYTEEEQVPFEAQIFDIPVINKKFYLQDHHILPKLKLIIKCTSDTACESCIAETKGNH